MVTTCCSGDDSLSRMLWSSSRCWRPAGYRVDILALTLWMKKVPLPIRLARRGVRVCGERVIPHPAASALAHKADFQ